MLESVGGVAAISGHVMTSHAMMSRLTRRGGARGPPSNPCITALNAAIVNSTVSLSAPSPQTLGGTTYAFVSWSDGGVPTSSLIARWRRQD